jgi:hypothetical protein
MPVPQPRTAAAIGYHTGQTKAFLFGGRSAYGPQVFGDTWQWSAGAWTLLSPAASPPPRFGAAMAYYATGTKLVLFGGRSSAGGDNALGDTWTFDGTTWAQVNPTTSPSARYGHQMVVDSTGQIVLFGGTGGANEGTQLGDSWGWNGTIWTLLA